MMKQYSFRSGLSAISAIGHRLSVGWFPLLPFLLLAGLILLFFHKMAFSNLILARGDTFLYFYPYWEAAAAAWRAGQVPLWNPHLFMGAPFLANSQVGFFYPLNWPVWLLFDTPTAVKASILLHLFIAGLGAYWAARWALHLEYPAATLTAVTFALSGYLTAQVEHVNQVQGMAWLPWFLLVLAYCARPRDESRFVVSGRAGLALAALFALQLLAGHTQTTFITGIAILVWIGAQGMMARWDGRSMAWRRWWRHGPMALLVGGGLAVLITAVQLFPTQQLAQFSARQGGLPLNEVLSFSLHPLLLTRALLPGYGQSLFSEYVAFLPITILLLAVIGGWHWRRWPGAAGALALVVVGLLLALGAFNPLNWLLGRVPGFNLFRAPARWMVLFTLGMALLAGLGWQQISVIWREAEVKRPLSLGIGMILLLIVWGWVAAWLVPLLPLGAEAPFERPTLLTTGLWLAELVLAAWWLGWGERKAEGRRSSWPLLLPALALFFWATRSHPYHNLTAPAAYHDLRPPVARLLAETRLASDVMRHASSVTADASSSDRLPTTDHDIVAERHHRLPSTIHYPLSTTPSPPDRFLSLSDIFFDTGDQTELEAIYGDQLDAAAFYDYVVAVKQQEIIAPNLPLAYGLAAVDGFDGGVLPLRNYGELMRLLVPRGEAARDGRLREHLDAVPEPRWLDLFNVRYLITDKTGDLWRDSRHGLEFSVFFDMQHPTTLAAGEEIEVGYVPDFPATALYLLGEGEPGVLTMRVRDGRIPRTLQPERLQNGLVRYRWRGGLEDGAPHEARPAYLSFRAGEAPWGLRAATLVNESEELFMPLVIGQYRQIHSGDVKIYENLDALPRTFFLSDWQWAPDVAASVKTMGEAGFDPGATVVLVGEGPLPQANGRGEGTAVVTSYAPEQVTIETENDAPALLLLTDAYYLGWEAAVDGQPTPLYQADALFRAVFVPAGRHEVAFTYTAPPYRMGRLVSLAGLFLWSVLALLLFGWRRLMRHR